MGAEKQRHGGMRVPTAMHNANNRCARPRGNRQSSNRALASMLVLKLECTPTISPTSLMSSLGEMSTMTNGPLNCQRAHGDIRPRRNMGPESIFKTSDNPSRHPLDDDHRCQLDDPQTQCSQFPGIGAREKTPL